MTCDLNTATLHELREQAASFGTDGPGEQKRDHLFASALDVSNLDTDQAALLAVAQRLIQECRGIDTPIEHFIKNLLWECEYHPLTIEKVREEMENLETHWEWSLASARKFYREYRHLVTDAEEETGETNDADDADPPNDTPLQ